MPPQTKDPNLGLNTPPLTEHGFLAKMWRQICKSLQYTPKQIDLMVTSYCKSLPNPITGKAAEHENKSNAATKVYGNEISFKSLIWNIFKILRAKKVTFYVEVTPLVGTPVVVAMTYVTNVPEEKDGGIDDTADVATK